MHNSKMYPPRFTLQVHGQNATHDAVALVEFKGACMDLSTEIYLSLPTRGTKKYAFYYMCSYIECVQSYAPFVTYYPSVVVTSVFWLVKLFSSSSISISHNYTTIVLDVNNAVENKERC